MKTVAEQISEFLDDYYPWEYTNPHEVSFEVDDKGQVNVVCSLLPSNRKASLEVCYNAVDVNKLILDLKLGTVRDLGKIKPAHLVHLYKQGYGSIFCDIGGDRDFVFYKLIEGNCMMIVADDRTTPVTKYLSQPEDFLKYTATYYSH